MHPGECTLLTCVSCFGECTMDECIPKYRLSQSTHVSFCIYWFLHLKWRVGGTAPIFMCALKDFCPPSQSLLNTLFLFLTRRVSFGKRCAIKYKACLIFYELILSGCARIWCSSKWKRFLVCLKHFWVLQRHEVKGVEKTLWVWRKHQVLKKHHLFGLGCWKHGADEAWAVANHL